MTPDTFWWTVWSLPVPVNIRWEHAKNTPLWASVHPLWKIVTYLPISNSVVLKTMCGAFLFFLSTSCAKLLRYASLVETKWESHHHLCLHLRFVCAYVQAQRDSKCLACFTCFQQNITKQKFVSGKRPSSWKCLSFDWCSYGAGWRRTCAIAFVHTPFTLWIRISFCSRVLTILTIFRVGSSARGCWRRSCAAFCFAWRHLLVLPSTSHLSITPQEILAQMGPSGDKEEGARSLARDGIMPHFMLFYIHPCI